MTQTQEFGWGMPAASIDSLPSVSDFPPSFDPPTGESEIRIAAVDESAIEWNAWDNEPPTQPTRTIAPKPARESRKFPLLTLIVGAMVLGILVMALGLYTVMSSASSDPAQNATNSRRSVVPGSDTTVTAKGITLTLGGQWFSVPTARDDMVNFLKTADATHPGVKSLINVDTMTSLAVLGFWMDSRGNLHALVNALPVTGQSDPAVLLKQAPKVVARYKGTEWTAKLTTFHKYPSLLIAFKIPGTPQAPVDQFVQIATVHSSRTSAAITVIARDPATAARQMNTIASTIVLR
jgi:hypothetical protein